MLRTVVAIVSLLSVADLSGASELTTNPLVTLRGRVTTPDDSPAVGTTITILQKHRVLDLSEPLTTAAIAIADSDGNYSAQVRLDPNANVKVEHASGANMSFSQSPRYDSGWNALPALRPYTITQNVKLARASMLAGRITDEQGAPIRGATIIAQTPGTLTPPFPEILLTTSSLDGSFVFEKAATGKLSLVVRPANHVPQTVDVTVPSGNVHVKLSGAGGTISGHVIDSTTSASASNARVSLRQWSDGKTPMYYWHPIYTTAAEEGTYRFEHLPPGKFIVDAELDSRRAMPARDGERLIEITNDQTSGTCDLRLYTGHTISGMVIDRATSTVLPGATVRLGNDYLVEPVWTTTTDAQGRYTFNNVFASMRKAISIRVMHPGYRMALDRSDTPSGTIDLSTRPSPVFETTHMMPTCTVTGNVVLSDGKPVEHVWVGLGNDQQDWPGRQHFVQSDAAGVFKLDAPLNSESLLLCEADDYPRTALKLPASTASTTHVLIQLDAGREVGGQVIDATSNPVSGARVIVRNPYTEVASTETDENGNFRIPQVSKDTLALQVYGVDDTYSDGPSIAPGCENHSLTIQLPQRFTITGRVTSKAGTPVKDAQVQANGGSGSSYDSDQTDDDGRYSVSGLLAGAHTVRVSSPKWRADTITTIAGATGVDFRVTSAPTVRVSGHVVNALTHQPFTNARVQKVWDTGDLITTPGTGEFTITNLYPAESVTLTITAPGTPTITRNFRASETETEQEETIAIGAPGILEGAVYYRDAERTPVPHAAVQVYSAEIINSHDARRHAPGNYVFTDANGRFRKEGLTVGEYNIELVQSDASLPPNTTSAFVLPGHVVQATELLMEKPRRLVGQVMQLVPVRGMHLTVQTGDGATTELVSAADGTFDIPVASSPESVEQDSILIASGGKAFERLQFRRDDVPQFTWLDQSHSLEGVVTRNGAPLEGVSVQLVRDSMLFQQSAVEVEALAATHLSAGPVRTGAGGKFRVAGIIPGRWHVTVGKTVDSSDDYEVLNGDADTFPESNGNRDDASDPADGVNMLTPARQRRVARQPNFVWNFGTDISVGADVLTSCVINVPGGNIHGVAVDESGVPMASANISARIAVGQAYSRTREAITTTDIKGHFAFEALDEGLYSIQGIAKAPRAQGPSDSPNGAPCDTPLGKPTTSFGSKQAVATTGSAGIRLQMVSTQSRVPTAVHHTYP